MNCPKCQSVCVDDARFCPYCGRSLVKKPRDTRGSHWAPLLVLTVLSVLGIALFFLIPLTPTMSETPWFRVENGELYFDSYLYDGPAELTVPETVDGQSVTKIAAGAFRDAGSLTTVILPASVTEIGPSAFSGCTALRGIFIPEGVTSIGTFAFSGCEELEAICIPSSVETIGQGAFDACQSLQHIFYMGTHAHWQSLYDAHISIKTHVYCTDGSFLHR